METVEHQASTQVIEAAGTQVAVQRRGPRRPRGLPLVVLHGGGPGCHAASDFALTLPMLGHRDAILVDLPGFGRTTAKPGLGPRFSGYAEVLVEVLGALELVQVDVLAQSLGGAVALRLAVDHPDRIRRIALISSQPVPPPTGTVSDASLGSNARTAFYASTQSPLDLRSSVLALEWRRSEHIPERLLRERHAMATGRIGSAVGADPTLLGEPEDLSSVLERVTAPTAVIWGRDDPFADVAYGQALSDAIPNGTFVTIDDAAHHPQSERPREPAAAISAHLDWSAST